MGASLHIATIRGIPIRLNVTFGLALLIFVLQFGAIGLPMALVLFTSVLLHELGHALVAQRLGIRIASIDLHVLGGAALMTKNPERPRDEILIAAAGPAVSFALAVGLGALALSTGGGLNLAAPVLADLIAYGAVMNLVMGVFNLVPALPMDGGRIFRALLAHRLGHLRATQIAARVARVLAITALVGGVFASSWSLALIGGFVFMLANREERHAEAEAEALRLRRQMPPWWDHAVWQARVPRPEPVVVEVYSSR